MAACLALLLAGCGTAPPVGPVLPAVPKVGSTKEADAVLADVNKARAAIEQRYAAEERICYQKFFVNTCLDKAKEVRRAALAYEQARQVDAEHFIRADRAAKRDAELAAAQKTFAEEEARVAAENLVPAAPREVPPLPPPRPPRDRPAERAARVARQAEQDRAAEAQSAANVAEFARRKGESEERQRRVTERVAERNAKNARAAEAKAKVTQEKATQEKAAQTGLPKDKPKQ
jgi:hypothetical protein